MRLSWASLLAATTRFAAMAWAEDIKGSFARGNLSGQISYFPGFESASNLCVSHSRWFKPSSP